MFRKKFGKEVLWFFSRHKLIVFICIISVLLIAKASNLPTWSWLPLTIQRWLQVPNSGSYEWEVCSISSNLGFAYVSSIITYILIQYIPERKNSLKAFVSLRSDLAKIYSLMSKLIAMFLFDMQIEKDEKQVALSDVVEIKHIYITDESKMCEIHPYKNGEDQHVVHEDYNLHKDSNLLTKGILQCIEKIEKNPNYIQLDSRIVDLLDEIKHNRFCDMLSYDSDPIEPVPFVKPEIIGFDIGFVEFIRLHEKLSKYNIDLTTYKFVRITQEERAKRIRWNLFHANRVLFHLKPQKAEQVASGIMSLTPDEEVFTKGVSVLLEMLVCYDAYPDKCKRVLASAKKLGKHLLDCEIDSARKPIQLLNYLQVIKRDRSLNAKERAYLRALLRNSNCEPCIKLGASILANRFDIAQQVFSGLSEEDQKLFIQLPIYRLWPNPPTPSNWEPTMFT